MTGRRASPLTLPWWHGMPFAEAYAMAASTPQDFAAPSSRAVVLVTHAANAADNGPWEWDESSERWVRPVTGGAVARIVDALPEKP